MPPSPQVGTVVTSHDARYLPYALGSLLAQSVGHDILVVDDGSPDREVSRVARELGLRSIRLPGVGAPMARNLGIEALDRPWILNFDHDNLADRRLVEVLCRNALRGRRTGISYCRAVMMGERTGPYWPVRRGLPWHLKVENFIDATSLFARKGWEQAGGFDADAGPYNDWDLWLGMVERGWGVAFAPQYLFWYRVHAGGAMRQATGRRLDETRRYVLRKHAGFVAGRHRWLPRNQAARLANVARRRLDRRVGPPPAGGTLSVVVMGDGGRRESDAILEMLRDGQPYEPVAVLAGVEGSSGPFALEPAGGLGRAWAEGARGAVIAALDPGIRERTAASARDAGYVLPQVNDLRAHISTAATLGTGGRIGMGAIVEPGARLGDLVVLSPGAHVAADAEVEDLATVGRGVVIEERAVVGRRAFLSSNVVVMAGVSVGEDAVVGAGAVVDRDVKPGAAVAVPSTPFT